MSCCLRCGVSNLWWIKYLDISENILKNEDERKKISNQLFDEKTLVVYKEIFKLIEKSISYDDFVKLATEK